MTSNFVGEKLCILGFGNTGRSFPSVERHMDIYGTSWEYRFSFILSDMKKYKKKHNWCLGFINFCRARVNNSMVRL